MGLCARRADGKRRCGCIDDDGCGNQGEEGEERCNRKLAGEPVCHGGLPGFPLPIRSLDPSLPERRPALKYHLACKTMPGRYGDWLRRAGSGPAGRRSAGACP